MQHGERDTRKTGKHKGPFKQVAIRLLRVLITPQLRGENDSKQSDEFQVNKQDVCHRIFYRLVFKKYINVRNHAFDVPMFL